MTYRYITNATPTDVDERGFTVEGAIAGTLVQTTYDSKLPRVDRLCLTTGGELTWVQGVAADEAPLAPRLPDDLLLLATVTQTWFSDATRTMRNDGIKVVPMSDIENLRSNVLDLYDLMAQQRLQVDANARLSAASKGLFVDAFRSNAQRDAGVEQDAVTFGGILMMPVRESVKLMPVPGGRPTKLAHGHLPVISQTLRTTSMKVNPYMAFDPVPARVTLTPSVDHAVQTTDIWAPSVFLGSGNRQEFVRTEQVGETIIETFNLRQIQVAFSLSGFGPGEQLTQVLFDGIDVTSSVTGA